MDGTQGDDGGENGEKVGKFLKKIAQDGDGVGGVDNGTDEEEVE